MTEYLLANMTTIEAEEALKTRKIVVLPVGAIHKHGDGPLGTDMFSCTELARSRVPAAYLLLQISKDWLLHYPFFCKLLIYDH